MKQTMTDAIHRVLALPLDVSGQVFELAAELQASFGPGSEPISEFLRIVHTWVPLNPHKRELVEAIAATYLRPTKVAAREVARGHVLPSEKGFKHLYDLLTADEPLVILLRGPRGCGKTSALNFFLSNYHRALIGAHTQWFRTDLSALYTLNKDLPADERLTIRDYHFAQLLYSALRFAAEDDLLRGFFVQTNASGRRDATACRFYDEVLRNRDAQLLEEQRLGPIWAAIVSAFDSKARSRVARRRPDESFSEEFALHVVGQIKPQHQSRYASFMQLFLEHLEEPGESASVRRLVHIFDSVDNIDRIDGRAAYWDFIRQLASLPDDDSVHCNTLVISVRDETYEDLISKSASISTFGKPRTVEVVVTAPLPLELVDHKQAVVVDPQAQLYRNRKERAKSLGTYDTIWDALFPRFARALLEQLHAELESVEGATSESVERFVLTTLFNGDIRTLTNNLIAAWWYVRAVAEQRRSTRDTVDRVRAVEEMIAYQRHILFEGSVMGGYVYMSPDNRRLRGNDDTRWCPNLFFVPVTTEAERWEGLCMLRALQYLDARDPLRTRTHIIEAHLREFLRCMRYSTAAVEACVGAIWRFGLVMGKDCAYHQDQREPTIRLSEKGRFIMNAPFRSPAIAYLMATGTRLSPDDLRTSSLVEWHYTDAPEPSDSPRRSRQSRRFIESMTKTAITLMRYVRSTHQREMFSTFDSSELAVRQSFIGLDRSRFELPSLDGWVSRLSDVIAAAGRTRGAEGSLWVQSIRDDLDGIKAPDLSPASRIVS